MREKLVAAVLFATGTLTAEDAHRRTVEELLAAVTEAIHRGTPDLELAREVDRTQLAHQLRNEELRWLRSEGAGPRTVAAVQNLAQRSAALPLVDQPVVTYNPPPSSSEIKAVFGKVVDYVYIYLKGLADFRCTLNTSLWKGKQSRPDDEHSTWTKPKQTRQELTFYKGQEVSDKDGRLRDGSKGWLPRSKGVSTSGEFATIMQITFAGQSKANFSWDHWERMNGKRLAVFHYSVEKAHSLWGIDTDVFEQRRLQRVVFSPAYEGFIYADPVTGAITRLSADVKNVPDKYILNFSKVLLKYESVELGGQKHNLPKESTVYLDTKQYTTLIEKRFLNYRKFESNSRLVTDELQAK